MAKLADAIAAQTTRKGPSCRVAVIMGNLRKSDPGNLADLKAALDDTGIAASIIARGLTKVGQHVTPNNLQRHRRGDCACHG